MTDVQELKRLAKKISGFSNSPYKQFSTDVLALIERVEKAEITDLMAAKEIAAERLDRAAAIPDAPTHEHPELCPVCESPYCEHDELAQLDIKKAWEAGYRFAALASREEWVSVEERLPNPEHTVLWCKVPICEPPVIGSIEDGNFEYATHFTHWMAMPNDFWPATPRRSVEKEG